MKSLKSVNTKINSTNNNKIRLDKRPSLKNQIQELRRLEKIKLSDLTRKSQKIKKITRNSQKYLQTLPGQL